LSAPVHVGAQYYRAPNPPRKDWGRDLRRMHELGFTTVKFWACWSWMHRVDDSIDFGELDELMDLAESAGLRVVVNTILENAPYWLERRRPGARYVDAEGRAVELGAAINTPGGGWPGLCFDDPVASAAADRFLAALVDRYASHPALAIWDVWNEPHLEPASYFPERMYCYCDASLERFSAWLRRRYGTLDALNHAWARRYGSWEEVAPPRRRETLPDLLDWREFWFENLSAWLARRAAVVRSHDSRHPVMTHVALSGHAGQLASHTIDEWTLTEPIDVFGTSSFPTWLMDGDLVEHAFHLETARDAAAGKPFWQAELQGGRGRRDGHRSTRHPSPEETTLWMWNALAAGAQGILFWQWRPELLGPESPGYGLCTPAGAPTARAHAAAAVARLVREVPALAEATPVPPTVGIVLSRRTALVAFASEGEIDVYVEAVRGAHRLLFDADVPAVFLHEEAVERNGIPGHVGAVYWPLPQVTSPEIAARMLEFAHRGGTLVAEAGVGMYDARGWFRSEAAPELEMLFGARVVESDVIERTALTAATGRIEGAWALDRIQVEGAEVIAYGADDGAAAVRNAVGDGRAVLIGTHPSLAYERWRDSGTRARILELLPRPAAQLRWSQPLPGRYHRHLRAPKADLVIAINATSEPAGFTIPDDHRLVSLHAAPDPCSPTQIEARTGALIELRRQQAIESA
jgi:beta-galactosidase GanA